MRRTLRDARAASTLRPATPIHWPRSLMARGAAALRAEHLRHQPAAPVESELHCFVLDCSASMRISGALARAKGLLLAMMTEAYRGRHRVALLCFSGAGVQLQLAPRRAAVWNDAWVDRIGGGGGTPLTQGMASAEQLLRRSRANRRLLWLLTDGRSREAPPRPASADAIGVIDFEAARLPLLRAAQLAQAWGADYRRHADIH